MKVLVIQTTEYDFCASTLIEGLHTLSEEGIVDLFCVESSNYAVITKFGQAYNHQIDRMAVKEFAQEADLVVLTSNSNVDEALFESCKCYDKTVYIDGEDVAAFKKKPSDFVLYFKREMLLDVEHERNVRPFPFGIEKRYYTNREVYAGKRDVFLSCMFGPHDEKKPWRKDIEKTLIELNPEFSIIRPMYGDQQNVLDTGDRDHLKYFEVLDHSLVSIDAYGAFACNAARFWEILACRACLITQPIKIHMPFPFTEGVHYFTYSNSQNLVELLLDTKFAEFEQVATLGHAYAMMHHTTRERAVYLLEEYDAAIHNRTTNNVQVQEKKKVLI